LFLLSFVRSNPQRGAFLKIGATGAGAKIARRDRRIGASQIVWNFEEYVGFQQALIGSSQIASKILSTEEFVASMNVGSSA
jgi:hypothetical protein